MRKLSSVITAFFIILAAAFGWFLPIVDFDAYDKFSEGMQKDLEIQQINIQERRVIDENKPDVETPEGAQQMHAIQQHFGMERQKRLEFRAQALEKKEETEKLAIGAEIVQGTLERQVEVHVGDDMREVMNMEVLVEDDKVIAIRS